MRVSGLDQHLPDLGKRQMVQIDRRYLDVDVHDARVRIREILNALKERKTDQYYDRAGDGAAVESDTESQAHARAGPHARRGRKAFYAVATLHDYGADAEEADAGYYLRAETRRVGSRSVDVADELVGHHREAGAHAHEYMRAEAGRAHPSAALEADSPAEHDRQKQPHHGRYDINSGEQAAYGVEIVECVHFSFLSGPHCAAGGNHAPRASGRARVSRPISGIRVQA